MKTTVVLSLAAFVYLGTVQPAPAQETKTKPWKTFSANLGGFIAATDSNVRLGTSSAGVDIDVEDTLGLEKGTTAFRVDAFWRFTENKHHRVDFTWFGIDRDASTTLGQDIKIGDTTVNAGSTVNSTFDFSIYKLGYGYSFFQDDRMDLAVSGGLYVAPFSIDIKSTGAIKAAQSQDVTAPLPVIGLRADFAITPKWFLKTNFDAFYLEIDSYSGYITDVRIAVEYNAFKNIGFGLGFDALNVGVESNESTSIPGVDFNGSIDFRYAGILAYGKVYFD